MLKPERSDGQITECEERLFGFHKHRLVYVGPAESMRIPPSFQHAPGGARQSSRRYDREIVPRYFGAATSSALRLGSVLGDGLSRNGPTDHLSPILPTAAELTAQATWVELLGGPVPIDLLCPQHGAIYRGADVGRFIDWFSRLPIGVLRAPARS